MTAPAEASTGSSSANWLYKNKEHGKTSAAASLVRSLHSGDVLLSAFFVSLPEWSL